MRTLIVLGAADGSLSTYRTARAMGFRTICVDMRPNAPGVPLADEFLPISTREPEAILAALTGRDDVAGVLAPSTDIALPTLRVLTDRLGLPDVVPEAAERASVDKRYFRGLCDGLGLPSYRWIRGLDGVDTLRYPLVIKPVDAQSGRGVTRCADPLSLASAVAEARRRSYTGAVVVEEEVAGLHCGAEGVVDDGRLVFLALTRRSLTPPPLALTIAHRVPAGVPDGVADALASQVDKLCAALGYRRGPLNLDVVVDASGEPHLIEMGARTSGNGLDALALHGYGVDTIRASIQAAVGEPFEITPHPPRPVLWHTLCADRAGELVAVEGVPEALAMPELLALELIAEPGQRVRPYESVADKLGYAVLVAESPDGLLAAVERLLSTVRFRVQSGHGHLG